MIFMHGCESKTESTPQKNLVYIENGSHWESIELISGDILYFRDHKTDMCFALFCKNMNTVTYVPCTDKVMAAIEDKE